MAGLEENVNGTCWIGRFCLTATLALALFAPAGCYYFSAQDSIREANDALTAAQEAGAAEKAPYPFALAEQYLNRARAENRLSDFASAKMFADQAKAYAEQCGPAGADEAR